MAENSLPTNDTQKHGKQPLSKLAVVSLVVAVLGICVPIAWDYYKNKSDLAMLEVGKLPLLVQDGSLKKVRIYYGTNEVNQITRFNFLFENTGRTPIQDRDIVIPIQICLSNGCEFIDASIDKVEPPSVAASTEMTSSNQILLLKFPLLNPSDKISFSGLVSGSNPVVKLQARVVGVRDVHFVDETSQNQKSFKLSSILPIIVSVATVILLSFLKAARGELRQAQTGMLILESDSERLSKFTKKSDFLNYINGRLDPFLLRIDKRQIIRKIEMLVAGEGVTEEVKPRVLRIIKDPVQETIDLNKTASKVILGTLIIALGYFLVTLFHIWF
jgi:hypothetical protein